MRQINVPTLQCSARPLKQSFVLPYVAANYPLGIGNTTCCLIRARTPDDQKEEDKEGEENEEKGEVEGGEEDYEGEAEAHSGPANRDRVNSHEH